MESEINESQGGKNTNTVANNFFGRGKTGSNETIGRNLIISHGLIGSVNFKVNDGNSGEFFD